MQAVSLEARLQKNGCGSIRHGKKVKLALDSVIASYKISQEIKDLGEQIRQKFGLTFYRLENGKALPVEIQLDHHGVYIRLESFISMRDGKLTRFFMIKPGLSQVKNSQIIRDHGSNQGQTNIEYIWIPAFGKSPQWIKKHLEDPLRNFFVDHGGWQKTDPKVFTASGIEHIHKEFLSDDIEVIKEEIASLTAAFFHDSLSLRVKHALRTIQSIYLAYVRNARKDGHRCIATAIATGGGKTISALLDLLVLKNLNIINSGDTVAMISHNIAAQDSFIDDVRQYYPDDFHTISSKNGEIFSAPKSKDKINILLMNTAWVLHKDPESGISPNRDKLYSEYGFGLGDIKYFIFDEAHRHFFGDNKENEAEKLVKDIMTNNPYTNWISGTAQTLLANLKANKYLKSGGSFCFTLAELLKSPEIINKNLPKLNFYILNGLAEFNDTLNDYYLTTDKLLAEENRTQLVKFVKRFFFESKSFFKHGKRRHMLVAVNQIKQVELLKEIFDEIKNNKNYEYNNPSLNVITITGDNDDKISNLNDYKKKINKSDESVTITCDRWLEAVNVPQWDSLVLLKNTSTYEFVFQAIGRLFRVHDRKQTVAVYDTSIDRCIEFKHHLRKELQAAGKLAGWDLKAIYDLVSIFYGDETYFEKKKLDFDSFYEKMNNYSDSLENSCQTLSANDLNLKLDLSAFQHINIGKNVVRILMDVSNGKSGKDFERIKKSLDNIGVEIQKDQKVKVTNVDKLLNFFANVVTFIRFNKNINCWQDFDNCSHQEQEDFSDMTSIGVDIFVELINNGLVEAARMQQIIDNIACKREFILNHD